MSAVCRAAGTHRPSEGAWKRRSDEALAYDLAVCVTSSQMRYEVAEAVARNLRRAGLLDWQRVTLNAALLRCRLQKVLAEPVRARVGARTVEARSRFPNRTATLLSNSAESVRRGRVRLRGILREARTPQEARGLLVQAVDGFGPKQASLFLRRVGYSAELAVLDRHVIEYLRICHKLRIAPQALARLRFYEKVEAYFTSVAKTRRVPVGCLDLAVWVTMRVAREEGLA